MSELQFGQYLLIGACGGMMAGLLGVGGGIIMVPLLMLFLKMEIHDAKAQSIAIIMISSVTGTIKTYTTGRLDWSVILVAGLAAAVMSPLGVALGEKIDKAMLTRMFAVLMIVTGARMLWQAPHSRPAAHASAESARR